MKPLLEGTIGKPAVPLLMTEAHPDDWIKVFMFPLTLIRISDCWQYRRIVIVVKHTSKKQLANNDSSNPRGTGCICYGPTC